VRDGKREREIKNEMVLDNRIKFYKINNRTAFRVTVFYLKKMVFREKREKREDFVSFSQLSPPAILFNCSKRTIIIVIKKG